MTDLNEKCYHFIHNQTMPAMEAEATIINRRRAITRESMARSRAKKNEAKHAAERIREQKATAVAADLRRARARQRMTCCRAKKKLKERDDKPTTPPTTTMGKVASATYVVADADATTTSTTGAAVGVAADESTTAPSPPPTMTTTIAPSRLAASSSSSSSRPSTSDARAAFDRRNPRDKIRAVAAAPSTRTDAALPNK